jgi:hypothetical protein
MSISEDITNDSEVADQAAVPRPLPPVRVRTRLNPTASAQTPPASAPPPTPPPTERPTDEGEYKVGYKCPPKNSQFKKGQIANPRGRPRGAKSLSTRVDDALSAEMRVTLGGRAVKMSKREAMVRQHVEKAMRGDLKTFAALVKLDPKARAEADREGEAPADLGADELAVLLAYIKSTVSGEDER